MTEVYVHGVAPASERADVAAAGVGTCAVRWVAHGDLRAHEHDRIADTLAELAGRVQLTVKGTYDEESLLRGVIERAPAVARLRKRTRGKPAAATYYERMHLASPSTPEPMVHAAFLVDREPLGRFRSRVAEIGRELGARACSCAASVHCAPTAWRTTRPPPGPGRASDHRPLAAAARPVRGTVWLAEQILEVAEREYYDEEVIRAELDEVEALRKAGEIDD